MAAMPSTDMNYKLQQKRKLLRPDRDKKSRQQEAYKWRDARRVYLAGSFDRWKRLRSKLGLKDSRLAWHLLEAHVNHCVECGMMESTDSDASSKDFFPALVKSVRRLCQKHFSFKHSVEVVGLLCLNVDNEEKENYSIKELIQRPIGLRVEALSSKVNGSSNKDARQPLGMADSNVGESETSLEATGDSHFESEGSSQQRMNADINDGHSESLEYFSDEYDDDYDGDEYADAIEPDTSTDNISMSEAVSSSQEYATPGNQQTLSQSIVNLENMEVPLIEQQNLFASGAKCMTKKMNKEEFSFLQMTPHLMFSEFSTLYPNISMRTFYRWKKEIAEGMDFIRQNETVTFPEFQKLCQEVSQEVFVLWKKLTCEQSHNASSSNSLPPTESNIDVEQLKGSNTVESVPNSEHCEAWTVKNIDSECEDKIRIVLKNKSNVIHTASMGESCDTVDMVKIAPQSPPSNMNMCDLAESETAELTKKESPSMFGNECSESNTEIQEYVSNKAETEYGGTASTSTGAPIKMEFTDSDEEVQTNAPDQLDSPKRKLELEMDSAVVGRLLGDGEHTSASDYINVDVTANCARKKRKYTSLDGIQHRREVYQKEEYELLEAMPFADYAEFSRHCPSVMKRTYFRWKRRIKEEYMYLEQNADMSFEEFSRVFPQAKQNIFSHWKGLMKQGYNFSSVHYTSDSSNHISSGNTEAAEFSDDGVKQSSYNFLQKNYQMEFSDFSKHFPTVTQQTFTVWKKKIQQEVQFLMSNPYYEMDYAVYSQCFPGVSKEVFSAWKLNMQQQLGSPQSGASIYPGASYWSPFLGQAARFGTVPWSDVKPNLWMNNPLLTHMWGTAMNLSALTRNEDAGKQQFSRSGSLPTDETSSARHTKPSTTGHHSPSDLGMEKHSPFRQTEADFASPKSRKQNKAEFYHFLQHPEMDFHDMSVAFPNLSLRTFYRWKREIKNAMCILEESHSTPFSEFHIYFPDIPVDIFNKWKEKISVADLTTSNEFQENLLKSSANINTSRLDASSIKTASRDVLVDDTDAKHKETEFQFLKLNPYISFSQFSMHFPHISMRKFYTWCKKIQGQINDIRKNPSISFEEFQMHFPDISSDVFQVWNDLVLSEKVSASELESDNLQMNLEGSSPDGHSPEAGSEANLSPTDLSIKHENPNYFTDTQQTTVNGMHAKLIHKASRPEYVFLQNNPTVDFREFFFRFPEVSGTTFYRWRREIKEIMDYIQLRPNTTYQEVVSYFPEISEDIFAHWKSIIQSGASDRSLCEDDCDPMGSLQAMVDNRTKNDETQEAFCYVMENPNIDKDEFSQKYPSLSQKLYYKWKKKVKELLLMLHSNPEIDFSMFSACSSDVPEDVFKKWKDNLTLYLDKAVSSGVEEHNELLDSKIGQSSEEWISPKSRKVNQAEFLFFLMNPFMDYQEFSHNFPQISLRTFYRWRRETRDGLEYLEEYPDVSYKVFCQMFPVVVEDVFQKWKMLISVRNKVKNKACYQKGTFSERLGTHARNYDTSSKYVLSSDMTLPDTNDQILQMNSSPSNTAELDSPTSLDKSVDGNQEMIPGKISDGSSSIHHKLDSSRSFIGFLSAAVENICKSAGLPPLDQSDSSNDGHNTRLTKPSSSVSVPLKLGGVAFPGLIPPDRPASNTSSSTELEEHTSNAEDGGEASGLGGIAFPGLTPTSCYSTSSNTTSKANELMSVINNTSSHPVQSVAMTQLTESGLSSQGFSSVNFPDFNLPTSSGFLSFDRQVKSESLTSSPSSEQMNLATSRVSSPSFGLERTLSSSSRSVSNIATGESPVSGMKCVSSASAKNGLHDDYFFSPRLRKQNREEYMYLQQNPSMDFQEFYKVYPTISLRTFYRWKREFREDGQIGPFQQKENTNTLNTGGIQHGQILDLSAKPGNVYNHSVDSEIS
ncbi:uncharacterized protein LOC121383761 [Gigantopelta aegis]|uniref:uncharacterized protein LOC121383761 n=1 Tax=Gigantopelta aegis TaxID=1735272 RepID=UPI001B888F8B|nr:uncharacterized protein LOC121383761 [Gigantopelta aegis]